MRIICPEHQGEIYVAENYLNTKNISLNNLVIECPVCDEEVLIDGVFDVDCEGVATRVN